MYAQHDFSGTLTKPSSEGGQSHFGPRTAQIGQYPTVLLESVNQSATGRHRGTKRRGVAVVEFAIVVPAFLLFLMAAFEFGWLNVMRHAANNAAYEGARAAMVPARRLATPLQGQIRYSALSKQKARALL